MIGLPEREGAAVFREKIIDEIFYTLGQSRTGAPRRIFGPLFRHPAGRLGLIAARADEAAATSGISGAARRILPDLSLRVSPRGTEAIPADGPLLIVANHPGGLDSVAVLASIPRNDMNVVISDVPFTRAFGAAGRYFVFAPPGPAGRAAALRTAIERLRAGEALLIFPHGDVEPDPEMGPGSPESIGNWSRSLEIMLRNAPGTRLMVAIASGALSPRFARSPLVRIRRSAPRRQKLAEVLQFIRQVTRPGSVRLDIHLSFAEPVEGADLIAKGTMPAVAAIAHRLLANHMETLEAARVGSGLLIR
ncbi:MAG TPA: lysophospholipid acyltransferase family protein [Acidobacteriota bacterium]|nr:lysophospholipid acyltransferase family protein [Acidobacteriota bacterium]